ncbi:MAG TPA: DEAD/DEAH box helicase [Phycisphaerae bacterium]|nr:DEAD/DEAH box helicase [Phycisphaerae bacterium]HNU45219.1 DEAD/DEAH box helicase [Phycisphaerae bacterium]
MKKTPELPAAFADLGVETRFLQALAKMQFQEPTDIQKGMIPPALTGRDVMGQARTGTGKTAAFALPVLQQLDPAGGVQALCLVPTRELAIQVAGEVTRFAEFTRLHVAAIYGGQRVATQLHHLGRKPHFVVGTPGRVMDFMSRRALDVSSVRHVILDEVDRMLDIGFRDDIQWILQRVTQRHQTIFTSATIEDDIKHLANRYATDPMEVNVSRDELTVDSVEQYYITVDPWDKFRLLSLFLKQEDYPTCIIFCNTRHAARKLAKKLHDAGVSAREIHGDLVQRKRDQVMDWFRKHRIRVLVATDLASRGIDISAITHIINYDIPADSEGYVHRIGRTARMGAKGIAVTLTTREEGKQLTAIESLINKQILPRQIEGFTASGPPRDAGPPPALPPQRVSRLQAPVFSEAGGSTERKLPPKTLGSRFRPSRRRRL